MSQDGFTPASLALLTGLTPQERDVILECTYNLSLHANGGRLGVNHSLQIILAIGWLQASTADEGLNQVLIKARDNGLIKSHRRVCAVNKH